MNCFACFMRLLPMVFFMISSGAVLAQGFPAKPLRLVVPYPTGTTTDLLGRIISPKMSSTLGRPIVVENRGGASGTVGAQLVATSVPDGYTLMLGTGAIIAANEALIPKLSYNPARDFAAVGGIAQNPQILTVGAGTGIRTMAELAEFLKKNSGKAAFGSTGIGGTPALAGAALAHLLGVKVSHVPYGSPAQALSSLLSGDITFMFYGSIGILPMVKAGQLRPLATGGTGRSGLFPDLRTMMELGYDDFSATSWFAVYVPAQTPRPVIDVLAAALTASLTDPETSGKLVQGGLDPMISTPEALTAFGAKERVRFKELVTRFGGIEN